MAVEVGGSKARIRPSMNVTPLVDVVLVLLVIFMVITPMMVKQFWLHAPKREAPTATAAVPDQSQVQLVLTLGAGAVTRLNKDVVPLRDLEARLKRVFAARNDRILFFDAHPGVRFGDAAAAMDAARAGGAANLVVLTEALQP